MSLEFVSSDFAEALKGWKPLGRVAPESLAPVRKQLHWAVQVIPAVAGRLVESRPDDSHRALIWDDETGLFIGEALSSGHRVGVDPVEFAVLVLDRGDEPVERVDLAGFSLAAVLDQLKEKLHAATGDEAVNGIELPDYDMPEHPIGSGESFETGDRSQHEELARWYSNASRLQSAVALGTLGASAVRVWPHHFDIATLVSLDGDGRDPEKARSIGFGMSPGDATYDLPYFYVNPWPRPEEATEGPSLDGGATWHTRHWFGAVLPANRLVTVEAAKEQAERVYAYLRSAMGANRALLGAL